ncbi:hypothetical protein M885DRAFT_584277 [Pelagophyceae sp. CCMP2097]|nr:hypothetical protein M885DRAFT_584277 [Pelagophyceae sp. CCMP2097]
MALVIDRPRPTTAQVTSSKPAPSSEDKRRVAIYKTLMRKAATPDRRKHLVHLADMSASDREPTGRVSRRIYEGLVSSRVFDRYARQQSTKLTAKQLMVRSLEASLGGASESAAEKLTTLKRDIGYKTEVFGPPGLATPRKGVLNSEGNEQFYSYDGAWQDGKMHGFGTYKFADGAVYAGHFEKGQASGEGTANYPGGTTYEGHWQDGRHHGSGVMRYASGSVYDGLWATGKRHGAGVLKYKSGHSYEGDFAYGAPHGRGTVKSRAAGFSFVGTFHKGFCNGAGALVWPDGKRDVRNWAQHGGLTLRQLVALVHRELAESAARRTRDRDAAFNVRTAIRLQDYVSAVRADIDEERSAKKAGKEAERRAAVKERKDAAKQAREEALDQLIAASEAVAKPAPRDALMTI